MRSVKLRIPANVVEVVSVKPDLANGLTMTPVYGGCGVGDQLGLTLVEQVVTRLGAGTTTRSCRARRSGRRSKARCRRLRHLTPTMTLCPRVG